MSGSFEKAVKDTTNFDDRTVVKLFWQEINSRGGVRKALDQVLPVLEQHRPQAARKTLIDFAGVSLRRLLSNP